MDKRFLNVFGEVEHSPYKYENRIKHEILLG